MVEKLKVELLPQDVTTKRLREEMGVAFEELTEEAEANPLPLVIRAGTEGSDGVSNQNSIRNGVDDGAPKDTMPLPMVSDNAKDSLTNKRVKTTPTGRSFADPKWCHRVAIISKDVNQNSKGANQFFMLVGIEVTKTGVSGEQDRLVEKRDDDFSSSQGKSPMSYDPIWHSPHLQQI